MAVICKRCGGSHPIWECRKNAQDDESRAAVQGRPSKLQALVKVNGVGSPVQPSGGGDRGNKSAPLPTPRFDKVAYQREYMRKRRAKQKAKESENAKP